MRKKAGYLAGIMLGLTLLLGLLAASGRTVYAVTSVQYPLWVGGTQVNSKNCNSPETNHWSYDAETHTLTLDGYSTDQRGYSYTASAAAAIYYNGEEDLTVSLSGTNSITMAKEHSSDCGIVSANAGSTLTFAGSGSLTIACAGNGWQYYYDVSISSAGPVVFRGGSIDAGDTQHPNYGVDASSMTVESGVIALDVKGYIGAFTCPVQNAVAGMGYYDQGGKEKADPIGTHTEPVALTYTDFMGQQKPFKEAAFPKGRFTLEFDPNGGSGRMDSWTVTEGETIVLPECGFDPPDIEQVFSRWDVTGVDLIGTPGTELLIARNCLLGGKITAEARWVERTEVMALDKPAGKDLTYNGGPQALVTEGIPWRGIMLFATGDSDTQAPEDGWSESIPEGTEAGTYHIWFMVKATVSGNTDSKPEYAAAEIKKRPLTVTAASQEWTYDGSAHSNPAVTVTKGTLPDGDTLDAAATGSVTNAADTAQGNNPVGEGVKVCRGDLDVTANYEITPVAGTLSIRKAAASVKTEPKAAAGLIENGSAQSLVTAGEAEGGVMQYAVGTDGKKAPASGWSASVPTAAGAGTCYVWYKAVGDENHLDSEAACVSVVIAEAEKEQPEKEETKKPEEKETEKTVLTVSAKDQTIAFGGKISVKSANYTVKGLKDGDAAKVTLKADRKTYEIVPAVTVKNGDSDVTADYDVNVVKGTLTVTGVPMMKADVSASGVTVQIEPVAAADKYTVYAQYCGTKKYKKAGTLKASQKTFRIKKLNGKKIDGSRNVKVYVCAYKSGKKIVKSLSAHMAGYGRVKSSNARAVSVKKSTYTLKTGRTAKISASVVLKNKKKKQITHIPLRFASSDKTVAKVDQKGKIRAVKAGRCKIYAVAPNGAAKKISVTVK